MQSVIEVNEKEKIRCSQMKPGGENGFIDESSESSNALMNNSLISLIVNEIGVDGNLKRKNTLFEGFFIWLEVIRYYMTFNRGNRKIWVGALFCVTLSILGLLSSVRAGSLNMMGTISLITLINLSVFWIIACILNLASTRKLVILKSVLNVYRGNALLKALGVKWYLPISTQRKNMEDAFYYISVALKTLNVNINFKSSLAYAKKESSDYLERKVILSFFDSSVGAILNSMKEGGKNYHLVEDDWSRLNNLVSLEQKVIDNKRVDKFMQILRKSNQDALNRD